MVITDNNENAIDSITDGVSGKICIQIARNATIQNAATKYSTLFLSEIFCMILTHLTCLAVIRDT